MMKKTQYLSFSLGVVLMAIGSSVHAQTITPLQGQSPEQIDADQQACYATAVQSSNYDPATDGDNDDVEVGGRARGAATAATASAVSTEVRGRQYDVYDEIDDDIRQENRRNNAGSAAAAGAVIGGSRQRRDRRQAEAETADAAASFDSSYAACLNGRGYSLEP